MICSIHHLHTCDSLHTNNPATQTPQKQGINDGSVLRLPFRSSSLCDSRARSISALPAASFGDSPLPSIAHDSRSRPRKSTWSCVSSVDVHAQDKKTKQADKLCTQARRGARGAQWSFRLVSASPCWEPVQDYSCAVSRATGR